MRLRPLFFIVLFVVKLSVVHGQSWEAELFPPEHKVEIDPTSGAKVVFVTTDKSNDHNLYFHDRSWLLDGKLMLFTSNRTGRMELFAYIAESGHLARLNRAEDAAAFGAVASASGERVYAIREKQVLQWTIVLEGQASPTLKINETVIGVFPAGAEPIGSLNENSDGTLLSVGYRMDKKYYIAIIDIINRRLETVVQPEVPSVQHIQFSWNRPDLLSFAAGYGSDTAPIDPAVPPHARIWFLNIHTRIPTPAFYQKPGELVTHECWWVNDQITFIGGHLKGEGHVKVLDLKTNEIKIIGAGAWWESGSDSALAEVNWWHASGSPDARWVAADNWHGTIVLFDARTTEKRTLTTNHRIYGGGAHPHVGWDIRGRSVVFGSNKNGNPDVCIAFIPDSWK
jgi:hypothetical protein